MIFSISLLALYGGVHIARQSFGTIRTSLDALEGPHELMRAANKLQAIVNESDRVYSQLLKRNQGTDIRQFEQLASQMSRMVDTLRLEYGEQPPHTGLMDTLQFFISKRVQLISAYLGLRANLSSGVVTASYIGKIDSLLSMQLAEDTLLVSSSATRKTTTTFDTLHIERPVEQKKNLLRRLFGKKQPEAPPPPPATTLIARDVEEFEYKIDTVARENNREESLNEIQALLNELVATEKNRQEKLRDRELQVYSFEREFRARMADLLLAVEQNVMNQTYRVRYEAGNVVEEALSGLQLILVAFGLAGLLLVGLMLLDVTQSQRNKQLLIEARREAERQSEARTWFLSNMSHEIRTPLQSIVGYAEQMRESGQAPEASLAAVHQASLHLLDVVNEVLDYHKLQAGKFVLQQAPFGVAAVVDAAVAVVRPQVAGRPVALVCSMGSVEQLWVKGDAYRLRQIMLNLLGNAVKYTEKGKVQLTLHTEESATQTWLHIEVADTGIGIEPDRQQRIFEEFEQATAYQGTQGTGLGLSITRALVQAHGGTIALTSSPGQGSTFRVALPYLPAQPQQQLSAEPVTTPSGEVWMVDDDALITTLGASIAQKHGMAYRTFARGEQVLEALQASRPALVLADVRMPGISGVQLAAAIKQKWPQSEVPVVAVTAQVLPNEQAALLQQGFNGVLCKPFTAAQWLDAVATYAAHPTAKVSLQEATEHLTDDAALQQRLVQDTAHDLALVQAAWREQDKETVLLVAHRLAGRFAQMGYRPQSRAWRTLEKGILAHDTLPHYEALAEAVAASAL